jgi:hypothetical protein
MAEGLWPAAG